MEVAASEQEAQKVRDGYMRFILDGKRYGVDVGSVATVIEPKEKSRVPRSGEPVEGVMDYRGEVAVIVSVAELLGVECTGGEDGEPQVIILEESMDNQTVGIEVDQVLGVRQLDSEKKETELGEADFESDTADSELIEAAFTDLNHDVDVIEIIDLETVLDVTRESSRVELQ